MLKLISATFLLPMISRNELSITIYSMILSRQGLGWLANSVPSGSRVTCHWCAVRVLGDLPFVCRQGLGWPAIGVPSRSWVTCHWCAVRVSGDLPLVCRQGLVWPAIGVPSGSRVTCYWCAVRVSGDLPLVCRQGPGRPASSGPSGDGDYKVILKNSWYEVSKLPEQILEQLCPRK